jgi:hypothetical protein
MEGLQLFGRRGSCGDLGEAGEHIDALQQHLNMLAGEDDAPFLGGHEAVFHHVGQPLRGAKLHDARRPFERMRRPHQSLEAVGVLRIALQRQQSIVQQRRLRLRLQAE